MKPRAAQGRDGCPQPSLPRIALALLVWTAASQLMAAPPAIWSGKVTDPAAVDAAWKDVPAPVRPAVDFQKLLLKIRSHAPVAEWRADMEKVASASGQDGVTTGLRELARH